MYPLIEYTAIYALSCQVASKMKKHRSIATVLFVTLSPIRTAENSVKNFDLILGLGLAPTNDTNNHLINASNHCFSPF